MSSSEESHLSKLTAFTPRMPVYLQGAADRILERTEAVATAVCHFLRSPVHIGEASIDRRNPEPIIGDSGDIFDLVDIRGNVAMRLALSAATVTSVTRSLFGGDVSEKPVLTGIGQSFCRKVAAALITDDTAPADSDGEEYNPLKGFHLIKAETDAIGHRPVLNLKIRLALVQPPDLEIIASFPRGFTDKISPPRGHVGDSLLHCLSFPITAIAGHTKVPFGEVRHWKSGDQIQLPGAELTNVQLMVSAGKTKESLAFGELGAADGMKSVRVNNVVAKPSARNQQRRTG